MSMDLHTSKNLEFRESLLICTTQPNFLLNKGISNQIWSIFPSVCVCVYLDGKCVPGMNIRGWTVQPLVSWGQTRSIYRGERESKVQIIGGRWRP